MKKTPIPPTRLLIVDDEQGFVDVLTNRLNRRGIDVFKAYSGAQALQALRQNIFDVMVLDLKMEDMDGIEVLKIVRKMAPDLPVIFLTGHGSKTAAEDGMTIGAFDYLTKPCELKELMEKISLARQAKNKQNGETNK
ncbi:response regulator [Desulfobacter hydrogenophilus]|uniref:Response regulator n=1 Tax=Desulfobacter hydrogenophilus TaxID=2291 RepID=A0A328FHN5_9BACT|nr:response regulator [Desulfobacter hydrogenophilus]NDY72764.1 response regulator [Desulfobacter hydrogenophilus]QBH12994.1 response regulator [Desulfobacter hydrogenophilus]RAM03979.1 response regulator [Desulfobacter hydrogenophilus]